MNCHGNNNQNDKNGHGHGHKGPMGHMLMMALCCGAPIIILLLLPLIGQIGGSGISKILLAVVPFLCPLMMVFMVPMMFKGNKNKEDNNNFPQDKQLPPGEKTQELE